mmetsp:Transcript_4127/g.9255  ORF Transcript_4127/g.9255 Transcript_4127/m.9255 type:complete len:141 (-) Transcript_4127:79-501(-)
MPRQMALLALAVALGIPGGMALIQAPLDPVTLGAGAALMPVEPPKLKVRGAATERMAVENLIENVSDASGMDAGDWDSSFDALPETDDNRTNDFRAAVEAANAVDTASRPPLEAGSPRSAGCAKFAAVSAAIALATALMS